MDQETLCKRIAEFRVIPVVALDSVDIALTLADALIEGGLPIIEVTFRTAAAAEIMCTLKAKRPNLIVGAGTVLTEANVRTAHECGAEFAVAPGLNPANVKLAHELNIPFIPGICTPSEIEQAMALGCTILKFFPAELLGGVPMLKALAAPYAHTGVRFVPTGGVNSGNLHTYLGVPSVLAAGGTWLAKKEDVVNGKADIVVQRCRETAEIVATAGK